MLTQLAEAANANPDPILPTGVGAGGAFGIWALWAFWLRDKIMGERPQISKEEWETVKGQAAKVASLERKYAKTHNHAVNMHAALRQISEYLDNDEHNEARAAARMARSMSDTHFTEAITGDE